MKNKSIYKSISIFIFILILFSGSIIYLSSKMVTDTLDNSDRQRVSDIIKTLTPMVKTSLDFSLNSFLSKNLDQIVKQNKHITKISIKDADGSVIIESSLYANTQGKTPIEENILIDEKRIGTIEAYPSNLNKTQSYKIYKEHLSNLIISVPFLIVIALFMYGSIIALHNKEKEHAYDELKKQMEDEIKNHEKKTNMMFHQSRLASMGEMISNIAHQWRQPLNTISLVLQNLKISFAMNNLKKETFDNSMEQIDNSLQYMTETITTFRNFYKTNTDQEIFTSSDVINESVSIIGSTLENSNIVLEADTEIKEDIKGYKNELTQVLVNILANAKETIKKRNTVNAKIVVKASSPKENFIVISVEDNAGGIEEKILDKIFDPYFTTKHKDQGTGLGLYMSKIIIEEKFKGKLLVMNTKDGARFDLQLNIYKKDEGKN